MRNRYAFDRFFERLPFKRRSASDWILPAAIGLGVGVACGVGLGLVMAPEPGDETRRKLRERASRMRERARILMEKARIERARIEAEEADRALGAATYGSPAGDVR